MLNVYPSTVEEQDALLLKLLRSMPEQGQQQALQLVQRANSHGVQSARELLRELPAPVAKAYRDSGLTRGKDFPSFYHEFYTGHNVAIKPGIVYDYSPVAARNNKEAHDGKSPHYARGYDYPEEFTDHFEAINDTKIILSLETVIRDNLRINHQLSLGDGRFGTNLYLVDSTKIKNWSEIKAVAMEFFDFMGFAEPTIVRTIEGNVVRFQTTYFDMKNIPMAQATITFTKMEDGTCGVSAGGCVCVENTEARPNYVKHLVEDWLGFYGTVAPANVVFRKIYWEYGRPSYRNVKSSRLGDPAFNEFYPWITEGIDSYIESYLNSKASVLLLIGAPGTGKSTLIRSMRTSPNARMFMADSEPLAREEDPFEKISQLFHTTEWDEDESGNGPSKKKKFDQNILIIEDADDIIGSRAQGNKNMTRLLSLTNGLDNSEQVKVIISTNLDNIEKVDKALLRPGRCFDILSFRNLTVEEAQKARAAIGKEPRDFGKLTSIPLSVALSDDQTGADTVVQPRYTV